MFELISFNPRSRGGSDTQTESPARPAKPFQSTLPRGERHSSIRVSHPRMVVSIHAPAGGATSGQKL